jgi:hypothetical protein
MKTSGVNSYGGRDMSSNFAYQVSDALNGKKAKKKTAELATGNKGFAFQVMDALQGKTADPSPKKSAIQSGEKNFGFEVGKIAAANQRKASTSQPATEPQDYESEAKAKQAADMQALESKRQSFVGALSEQSTDDVRRRKFLKGA